eukprot:764027-Hanusia_phi.AAC.9
MVRRQAASKKSAQALLQHIFKYHPPKNNPSERLLGRHDEKNSAQDHQDLPPGQELHRQVGLLSRSFLTSAQRSTGWNGTSCAARSRSSSTRSLNCTSSEKWSRFFLFDCYATVKETSCRQPSFPAPNL